MEEVPEENLEIGRVRIMEENKLPEIFETFGDARKNGFVTVKELKDKGKKVVEPFVPIRRKNLFMLRVHIL